jgi:hypothetical protein
MMEALNVKSLAIGLGGSCAVGMLFLGWVSAFGWGTALVEVISSLYIGFTPGLVGGIIGAIWGFVDGAIGGAILACIYNAVMKKK